MVSHDSYRMHNLSITIPCLIYFKFSLSHILSQDIEVNYDPLSEKENSCKRLAPKSNLGANTSTTTTITSTATISIVNAHNVSTISVTAIPVKADSKNDVDLPEITHFKDDAQVKAQEQVRLQEKELERLQLRQVRDNLEQNAVKRYKSSPAFAKAKEERAAAVLKAYRDNVAKKAQEKRDHRLARLLSEGGWFMRWLPSPVTRERFLDMSLHISTRADLLHYEKFLEHRIVPLWDCRGSVAKYCMEFREELILVNG